MMNPKDIKVVACVRCNACGSDVTEIVWRDDVEGTICLSCYEEDSVVQGLIGTETGFYGCVGTAGNLLHSHDDYTAAMTCTNPESRAVCWLSVMIQDVKVISTTTKEE